jgi:hypothetical protein
MIYSSALDNIPNTSLTDKCIVLDLDETLVHSFEKMEELRPLGLFKNPQLLDIRKRAYRIQLGDTLDNNRWKPLDIWGVTRPNLDEFLCFCFKYFRIVAVWSAGQSKYVESICDFIFRDIRPPHIIYSWPDCEKDTPDGHIEKPLQKMIDCEPHIKKYMSLTNTFVIDDRYSTFANCNLGNGVLIPPYSPHPTVEALRQQEPSLLELKRWFTRPEVVMSKDVRKLDKSKIFSRGIDILD